MVSVEKQVSGIVRIVKRRMPDGILMVDVV